MLRGQEAQQGGSGNAAWTGSTARRVRECCVDRKHSKEGQGMLRGQEAREPNERAGQGLRRCQSYISLQSKADV